MPGEPPPEAPEVAGDRAATPPAAPGQAIRLQAELFPDHGKEKHGPPPPLVKPHGDEFNHEDRPLYKAVLTVIAFLLAVLAFGPLVRPLAIQAQAGPDHAYLHFDPEVTKITLPDGSADIFGRVAIDLRNGNVYGFPAELVGYPRRPIDRKPAASDPIYLGRFNIDKIEAGTGWRRPRVSPRPGP